MRAQSPRAASGRLTCCADTDPRIPPEALPSSEAPSPSPLFPTVLEARNFPAVRTKYPLLSFWEKMSPWDPGIPSEYDGAFSASSPPSDRRHFHRTGEAPHRWAAQAATARAPAYSCRIRFPRQFPGSRLHKISKIYRCLRTKGVRLGL